MNCQNIAHLLDEHAEESVPNAHQLAFGAHLIECEECRSAWRAARALRALGACPADVPRTSLFDESIRIATRVSSRATGRGAFWRGTAVGGAVAASVVLAMAVLIQSPQLPESESVSRTPPLEVALRQTKDVQIGIDSKQVLADAEIRIVLSSGLRVAGFLETDTIRWRTDLAPGINRLTLPIVGQEPGNGMLLVEVGHESLHETFVVEINVNGDTENEARA